MVSSKEVALLSHSSSLFSRCRFYLELRNCINFCSAPRFNCSFRRSVCFYGIGRTCPSDTLPDLRRSLPHLWDSNVLAGRHGNSVSDRWSRLWIVHPRATLSGKVRHLGRWNLTVSNCFFCIKIFSNASVV